MTDCREPAAVEWTRKALYVTTSVLVDPPAGKLVRFRFWSTTHHAGPGLPHPGPAVTSMQQTAVH